MHPFLIASEIESYGYTYTYWMLRDAYSLPRLTTLWLLWVARQYIRHRDQRSLLDDLID